MITTQTGSIILYAFGEQVKRARLAKGWTQHQLAEACEMELKLIIGIESGNVDITLLTLLCISRALGIPMEEFLK